MAASPPRSPLAWLLLPLVVGYVLAPRLPTVPMGLAAGGSILACAALITACLHHRRVALVWPWLAFIAAAMLAGGYLQLRVQPPPGWEGLPPREAKFTLKVARLFNSGSDRIHGFATIAEADSHLGDLVGQTLYFSMTQTEGLERWPPGSRLPVVGILEKIDPKTVERNDSFSEYLLRSGAHFQYKRVALLGPPVPGRGFFSFCARQQDRFELFLRRGDSGQNPSVNVYVAMLLGKRGELADDQKTAFLQTGTLHLFAISGLHIGIIAFSLHTLLTLLKVPEKPAAAIGLSLLFCFVGITGAAPSAVRAFLMVFFFWGARFLQRAPNPVAALANSAVFVLLLFPHQLWSPGFQLSYAVVAGILFLGLPLGAHLREKWTPFSGLPPDAMSAWQHRISRSIQGIAAMLGVSLAATLFSSPLSIHYFGLFTPGGIVLNLLLIPAAGLVIVAGFISVTLNLVGLGWLGVVFNHAAWLIIHLMELIVGASPAIPYLFWQAKFDAPWQGPLLISVLLITLLLCAHRRWEGPIFHFAAPFLLFTIGLLLAARLTFLAP